MSIKRANCHTPTLLLGLLLVSACHSATRERPTTCALAENFLHQLFVQGDSDGAYECYAAPDIIQHNPRMGDGIAGRKAYFAAQARKVGGDVSAWRDVNNILLVDGDLLALHHHVFSGPTDPGRVFSISGG